MIMPQFSQIIAFAVFGYEITLPWDDKQPCIFDDVSYIETVPLSCMYGIMLKLDGIENVVFL